MSFNFGLINFLLLYGGGAKGGLLDVNPGLIFWTIVTFIILLIILKKTAWQPILTALKEREESIRSALEKAERARKEADEIFEKNQKSLAEAEEQVRKIINEGKEYANKLRNEIISRANEEAQKMIDNAKQEIETKKQEALLELKEIVADLSIQAAEKILEESLDREKHKKLIEKLIQNLPKG
ncbi:MAG: F0F1 ATP synthase subunit B [Ignavibacteria bacterium]|nr:F0F1 ATP synthase subunit B [Ignavibacteria bacterium]